MVRTDAKAWCFTSFATAQPELHASMQYLVFQKERAPTTGALHWQGFVYFKQLRSLTFVRSLLDGRAHWSRSRSPSASIAYAQKELPRVEGPFFFGEAPDISGETMGHLDAVIHDAFKAGSFSKKELLELFPEFFFEKTYQFMALCRVYDIKDEAIPSEARGSKCYFVTGPPGCGKTSFVQKFANVRIPCRRQVFTIKAGA
eukprot:GHVN01076982.1.p1 GENE.GHVN01076982.1~~GHVN01076982.1.p1  ORF type:complete len:201 (+),score=1.10 GHVN01076982.1:307-909(+)